MKAKGKKADKKNVSLNKKEKKSVVTEATEALAGSELMLDEAVERTPATAQSDDSILPAPANVERRTITNDERQRLIALAAYFRAQQAGFGKTNPVEDWLLAEREVDAMIGAGDSI